MNDRVIARRIAAAAAVGVAGVTLLALFADRIEHPWARPLALLGVVASSLGAAYAAGLWIAPSPRVLLLRHLAAGGAAAWLARELATTAARLGLEGTADAFRVFWAPVSEEACKALLLAAVWSQSDDRRDRRELVTAAVGVGVGFAMRENLVYFAGALGQTGVAVEWILLRAVPPVLAHAAFAMILGGTIAQSAIHARVCGEPVRRVSLLGVAVAVIAHVTYNGVALLLTRGAETYAVELAAAWSLVAAIVAVILRRRTIATAAEDQPVVTTHVPNPERSSVQVLGFTILVALLVGLPWSALRGLGVVCTPVALGALVALAVSRVLRVARPLTPLILGIGARPVIRAAELCVGAWGPGHGLPARLAVATLAHACFLVAIAHATRVWAGSRGVRGAVAFAVSLAAGLAGADLGTALSNEPSATALRTLAIGVPHVLLTTMALGAIAGRFGYSSAGRAWGAALGAAVIATALDALGRVAHGFIGAVVAAVVGLGVLAAVVYECSGVRRRDVRAVASG